MMAELEREFDGMAQSGWWVAHVKINSLDDWYCCCKIYAHASNRRDQVMRKLCEIPHKVTECTGVLEQINTMRRVVHYQNKSSSRQRMYLQNAFLDRLMDLFGDLNDYEPLDRIYK